jgi:hypothetical protein
MSRINIRKLKASKKEREQMMLDNMLSAICIMAPVLNVLQVCSDVITAIKETISQ